MGRRSYTATLSDMMINNGRWYGDHPSYVQDGRSLTFRQYLDSARQLASALSRVGVLPEDRVGVLSMNSIKLLVTYGACQLTGYVASTVNFRLAAPEMEYVIGHAGQKVLIFEAGYAGHIDSIRARLPGVRTYVCIGADCPPWATGWEAFLATGDAGDATLPVPEHDDLCYLMFTSGTTGKPKGVMMEQRAQLENGRSIAQNLQLGHSDRMLLMMPLFHVGAKALENAAQWVACTLHIHRQFDPVEIFRTIEREKITISHMAPTMIQTLIEHPDIGKYDLSSLRGVLYSAAAMPTSVLRRALAIFGPIFTQMYGATEGSGTVLPRSAHRPDGDERDIRRLSSIGHPIQGMQVKLVDDDDNEVPLGEPGELCYRGPVMMRGYWNNADATADALRGGWMHSGDVARCDEEGYLYLVDRKKDIIISGGENVYSREVEEALLLHEDISEAAVIGMPHEKWGEAVCAVLVLRTGATMTAEEVVAHSRQHIAGYKRPQAVHFVSDLPKLVSGKVSKIDLRRMFAPKES